LAKNLLKTSHSLLQTEQQQFPCSCTKSYSGPPCQVLRLRHLHSFQKLWFSVS